MEESIKVALGYIKSKSLEFAINLKELNKKDFHIHIPSNAIKKDGPSAGITIATAILSHLKNAVIDNSVSMSGEITLTGNILKVGGLKEKIIAAINNEVKKVYFPKQNQEEILELEYLYKDKLEIIYVNNYQEIYQDLFAPINE